MRPEDIILTAFVDELEKVSAPTNPRPVDTRRRLVNVQSHLENRGRTGVYSPTPAANVTPGMRDIAKNEAGTIGRSQRADFLHSRMRIMHGVNPYMAR